MNIHKALTIPGFTNLYELEWLAKQASAHKRIVEIGSWKGRSTRAMADNLSSDGVLYAVDTWNGTPEDPHFKELIDKPADWLYNQFLEGLCEYAAPPTNNRRVVPVRQASVLAAKSFSGTRDTYGQPYTFDMIFIDAGHSYADVKADCLAWRPLLAPGGLFCGHDYEPGRGGVIKAVNECVPTANRLGIGTIWIEQ